MIEITEPPTRTPLATTFAGDRLFAAVFSRILVYTILFEDNEKDLEFLALEPGERVFTVGGAGCGVAAMLGAAPARIDVVDFNRHHLAVTALKVAAAREMGSYEEFHQLLGHGRHARAEAVVSGLAASMPEALAAYWKRRWRYFERDFYAHGFYTKNLNLVRPFWPLTPQYLKELNQMPTGSRGEALRALLTERMTASRLLAALIRSPLSLLGAGINFTQRARNLRAVGSSDVVVGVIDYAGRLAETDIEGNWIAWHIATGAFNHERPDCLPLYLRPSFHARALGSPTEVGFHHGSLLDRLRAAEPGTWSRFCLSDVLDWLGDDVGRMIFREIHRVAAPGARVICRTVEDDDLMTTLGLEDTFRLVEPFSTVASQAERSKLYRRVNCYEVLK